MWTFFKEYSRALLKGNNPSFSFFTYHKRWNSLVGKDPLSEKQPWLTFKAIDFIADHIKKTDAVFEFGGGGSSMYFLDKVREVVTVEHDPEWFRMLESKISKIDPDRARWKGQLIMAEKGIDTRGLDRSKPEDYYSDDPLFSDALFKKYCTFIDQFDDGYFDLVLIDGRARTSCLHHAIPKVKTGGLLILDNAERKYYLQNNLPAMKGRYKLQVNDMGPVPYSPYFSKTAIWQRIK